MILRYYGHACFTMSFADGTTLAVDPFDESITYAPCNAVCTAALLSHHHHDHDCIETLNGDFTVIDTAGDFAVNGIKVSAMHTWHDHHHGAHRGSNLMFRIESDGLSIAHLGDLGHLPDDDQAAFLKDLDVLLVPVGGHYTIDTDEACEVIRKVKPRIAVAMHYRTDADPDFDARDCTSFVQKTNAVAMPNTLELTPDTVISVPSCIIMAYE